MAHLRYRFRVYPTLAQQQSLARGFGCSRVVYNDVLDLRERAFRSGLPYPSDSEVCRKVITEAKRTPERSWLGEVSTTALQQAVRDANKAYRDYFASKLGKRKGALRAPAKRTAVPADAPRTGRDRFAHTPTEPGPPGELRGG